MGVEQIGDGVVAEVTDALENVLAAERESIREIKDVHPGRHTIGHLKLGASRRPFLMKQIGIRGAVRGKVNWKADQTARAA